MLSHDGISVEVDVSPGVQVDGYRKNRLLIVLAMVIGVCDSDTGSSNRSPENQCVAM